VKKWVLVTGGGLSFVDLGLPTNSFLLGDDVPLRLKAKL
jgi:hypothetical protein